MRDTNPENDPRFPGHSHESNNEPALHSVPSSQEPQFDKKNEKSENRIHNMMLGSFVLGGATAGMTLSTYVVLDTFNASKILSLPISVLSGIAVFAGTFNAWKKNPKL